MIGRRWLVALTAMVSLGGCGAGDGEEAGGEPYRPPSLPELREQARGALARYDDAAGAGRGPRGLVPLGELTDFAGELDGGSKQSLAAGLLVPAVALPAAPDRPGMIVWADGVSREVPVISAQEALAAHRQPDGEGCGDCAPLTVTGARLVTMRVATTTVDATVPAWEYTLDGTALKVTYGAVGAPDVVTVTTPPWDPDDPADGESIDAATTVRGSKQVTVSFTGAHGPASEPCGQDYHAEAIGSANAVVVILVAERRHGDGNEICPMIGFSRTETVSLARPLGGRAMLEGRTGRPVGVTVKN